MNIMYSNSNGEIINVRQTHKPDMNKSEKVLDKEMFDIGLFTLKSQML